MYLDIILWTVVCLMYASMLYISYSVYKKDRSKNAFRNLVLWLALWFLPWIFIIAINLWYR